MEAPVITKIEKFEVPDYSSIILDNGVPVHFLNSDSPDIIKMDIVFYSGRTNEDKRAVSKAVGALIKDGVPDKTSSQIAEELDYYGATLVSASGMDTTSVSLYCLRKYFDNIWALVVEILTNSQFLEEELQKYKSIGLEKLKIELTKNDVIAYRNFTEKIFGENHPYGYNTMPQDYNNLKREDLLDYYKKNIQIDNCKIFLTGNVTDEIIGTINSTIGSISGNTYDKKPYQEPIITTGNYTYQNNRPYQTAIRIGRRLFDRTNPDYPSFYLLNTILGGYFGSRLSQNIREDKGYTYGIYSGADMLMNDGYFSISTDVGNEHLENTLLEIYKEIDILKNNPVGVEELELVKNYIFGNMLSLVNGNMNSINLVRRIEMFGLGKNYFSDFLNEIGHTDSAKLIQIANKYLNVEDFTRITVGDFSSRK